MPRILSLGSEGLGMSWPGSRLHSNSESTSTMRNWYTLDCHCQHLLRLINCWGEPVGKTITTHFNRIVRNCIFSKLITYTCLKALWWGWRSCLTAVTMTAPPPLVSDPGRVSSCMVSSPKSLFPPLPSQTLTPKWLLWEQSLGMKFMVLPNVSHTKKKTKNRNKPLPALEKCPLIYIHKSGKKLGYAWKANGIFHD